VNRASNDPDVPRSLCHSVRRVFPSTAGTLAGMQFSLTPGSSMIVVIQLSDIDVAFAEI
jgi:hypothetical protein